MLSQAGIIIICYHRIPIAGFILAVVMVITSAGAATGVAANGDLGISLGGVRDPNGNQ